LGLIEAHPLLRLKRPKEQQYRFIPLTPKEVDRLIEAQASDVMRAFVLILSETALRKTEGLTLKWTQLDFINRVLTTAETKTHRSRDIPLSDAAIDCLKNMIRHVGNDHVFMRDRRSKLLGIPTTHSRRRSSAPDSLRILVFMT
jgi:integrase